VEGAELEVLKTVDFSRLKVRVMMVELDGHNKEKDAAVVQLLRDAGFDVVPKRSDEEDPAGTELRRTVLLASQPCVCVCWGWGRASARGDPGWEGAPMLCLCTPGCGSPACARASPGGAYNTAQACEHPAKQPHRRLHAWAHVRLSRPRRHYNTVFVHKDAWRDLAHAPNVTAVQL
jgi:hypothetical protein